MPTLPTNQKLSPRHDKIVSDLCPFQRPSNAKMAPANAMPTPCQRPRNALPTPFQRGVLYPPIPPKGVGTPVVGNSGPNARSGTSFSRCTTLHTVKTAKTLPGKDRPSRAIPKMRRAISPTSTLGLTNLCSERRKRWNLLRLPVAADRRTIGKGNDRATKGAI